MTIQTAIEKAVEGGYNWLRITRFEKEEGRHVIKNIETVYKVSGRFVCITYFYDSGTNAGTTCDMEKVFSLEELLLDPHVWRCLGKAMRWDREYYFCDADSIEMESFHPDEVWKMMWHRLIDHLADGGTIESFFEGL